MLRVNAYVYVHGCVCVYAGRERGLRYPNPILSITKQRGRLLTAIILGAVVLGGCGGAAPTPTAIPPTPQPTETPIPPTAKPLVAPVLGADEQLAYDQGKTIYVRTGCTACHSIDGVGTQGQVGSNLTHVYQYAVEALKDPEYKGKAKTSAEFLRESVLEPNMYVPNNCPLGPCAPGQMPTNYNVILKPTEIDQLLTFLVNLK